MKRSKSKKIVAGLLLLTLILTLLTACGGSSSKKDTLVGTWKVVTIEAEGETMNVSDYEAVSGEKLDFTFEFKSDDTALITVFGESAEGTYTVDGNTVKITGDGESLEFTLNGDKLVGDFEGVIFTLTK